MSRHTSVGDGSQIVDLRELGGWLSLHVTYASVALVRIVQPPRRRRCFSWIELAPSSTLSAFDLHFYLCPRVVLVHFRGGRR